MPRRRRSALRFFVFLIGASVAGLGGEPARPAGRRCSASWPAAATWLARLTGSSGTVHGDQIHVGGLLMHINFECTGVYVLLILFVFLVAYPASWRARAARRRHRPRGADGGQHPAHRRAGARRRARSPTCSSYLHEYVWQGVFLVLVIAYAMTWVERVR